MRVWLMCGGRRKCVRAAAVASLVLLVAAILCRTSRPHCSAHLHLPAPPHQLAAALADFSNHPSLYPNIDSWRIQEEASKLRWWRYSVKFECGGRCAGAAVVQHQLPAPDSHLAGETHLLNFLHTYCIVLPIFSWPQLCDVIETEVEVSNGSLGGSSVSVIARCRRWPLLTDACAALSLLPTTLHSWSSVLPL